MLGSFYDYMSYSTFQLEVTVELGGLVPNTEYHFVYVPVNDVSGCFTETPRLDAPAVFTTTPPTPPNQVDWLYQSGATGGGIRVEWDIPVDVGSDSAIFYQVYMSSRLKSPVWELVYNHTGTYFWKTKLDSEKPYLFMVSCMNDVGYSENSSTATLNTTFISVPGPTGELAVIAATGGMIHFSWGSPSDNGGREVLRYVVSGNERDVEVEVPEIYFGGLVANKAYTFTVYAVNALGLGTDGVSAEFMTGSISIPSEPRSIEVVAVSGGSATIAITAPKDTGGVSTDSLTFEIYANDVLVPSSAVRLLASAPPPSVSLKGRRRLQSTDESYMYIQVGSLLPTTLYTFSMKVGNAAGSSERTDSTSGDTLQAGPPERPAPPSADLVTGGSLSLSWYDPVDTGGVPLTSYKLVVTTAESDVGRCKGLVHSCVVGDLQSLTEYSVVLTAFNSVGASPSSEPIIYTTSLVTQPQAPQNPRVVSVTNTLVLLEWSPCIDFGGNYVETYYIEVVEVQNPASIVSASVDITALNATVDNLSPDVEYYATIVSTS